MKEEKSGPEDLKTRTKSFALRVIRLYSALPKRTEAQVLGRQLLRSGTSVGAHYREASRARSDAEFISKLEGGLQKLEESIYWMELIVESDVFPAEQLTDLIGEANELAAILVSCAKNAKATRDNRKRTWMAEARTTKNDLNRNVFLDRSAVVLFFPPSSFLPSPGGFPPTWPAR